MKTENELEALAPDDDNTAKLQAVVDEDLAVSSGLGKFAGLDDRGNVVDLREHPSAKPLIPTENQSIKAALKSALSLAILLALASASSVTAGTLKLPGSNITRNAGTSIPVVVQASGFPSGSVATISLVNAKTWQSTEWAWVPIVNGNNSVNLALYWSFVDVGNYVVKIKVGNNQCTSTWIAKVRSAVIWPYSGTVFYRGAAAAVTWTVPTVWPLPIVGDFFDISLVNETNGEGYEVLDSFVDPDSGRLDFIVPDLAPGTYRILINGWFYMEEWQDEWDFPWPDQTRSEKITIR